MRSWSSCFSLAGQFFETVGDRVLEVQRAALVRGGIPCVGSVPCAGGLEERSVEPGLERIRGPVVAVGVGGADERRGARVVAVDGGDGGHATEALGRPRADDQGGAEGRRPW